MTADLPPDTRIVLDRVVIRVGDLALTRGDLARWAMRFDTCFRERVARRAALGELDDGLAAEAVETAAAEFRYERDLEDADALRTWLVQRGLTVTGWWESVRRDVLEQFAEVPDGAGGDAQDAAGGEDDADEVERPEEGEEPDEVWLADLALTNLLDRPADALARRLAVAETNGGLGSPGERMDDWFDALEERWERWRAPLLTEAALLGEVRRNQLAWLVLDLVATSWPGEDGAREALACVRLDGKELLEVAAAAGMPARVETRLLDDLPEGVREALLTAAVGEVVGPLLRGGAWVVLELRGKHAATADHPLVRSRAEEAVAHRAAGPLVERFTALKLSLR